MDKSDCAGRFAISDEGGFALDIEFEAMARLVVVKILSHAHSCFGAGAVKCLPSITPARAPPMAMPPHH
jgi:hypothetical protein